MRVRFCLGPDQKVYRSIQTWTTAAIPNAPATTDCPGTGWTSSTVVAENVVNGTRPLFTYNAVGLQDVTEVTTSLYVDVNPGKSPAETELQSSVYLRNQNRKPEALFSVEVLNNSIVLNASESTDPEEKALIYKWKIDNVDQGEGILRYQAGVPRPTPCGSTSPTACFPTTRPTPSACPRRHRE